MFQDANPFSQSDLTSPLPWNAQQAASLSRHWEVGEYAYLLNELDRFLDSVLHTTQIPFEIRCQNGGEAAIRNPVDVNGYRSLKGFLPLCGQWLDLYWPEYHYTPDLQLYFDCFRSHAFSGLFADGVLCSHYDQTYVARLYNDFVGFLRIEAVRRGVSKSLFDWRGNLADQEKAIRINLEALQYRYRVLIPVRPDLYYSELAMSDEDARIRTGWGVVNGAWSQVPSAMPIGYGQPETAARIDSAIAMADRDRFFSNQRGADSDLFEHMVGYVCKMEQGGVHRANHFHCVFFFDGTRVTQTQAEGYKYRIGDRWRKVTRGQGLMYDCHTRPDRAALEAQGRWALNVIKHEYPDQGAKFVDYVVGYFAKDAGQMVRVKPGSRARTLTMGR